MVSSDHKNSELQSLFNPFQNAVVLTGGIATGKSTVASLFIKYGFEIIDADKIAHKLLDTQYEKIAKLFGDEYIKDKKVLRKKLGSLIFNNATEKAKLEQFIHPLIKEEIINQATVLESQKRPYLIDIPLFFEKPHYDISKSIVVYIPKDIQLKRLMKRDQSSYDEAMLRINNQIDIETKRLMATYVIDNSKELNNLENEVKRVVDLLM